MKKTILILTVTVGFFAALPMMSWAQVDPNINTSSTDLRSNGSDGSPGFNPCVGGTNTNGVCGGSVSASALLSSANLTLFSKLGPGAVTDNMFGIIRQPVSPGTCGAQGANGTSEATSTKLNCGDVFFNPANQGQTGLAGTNDLAAAAAPLDWNTSISADFCANGATDCLVSAVQLDAAHVGFNVVNDFSWDRLSGTTAAVVSSQTVEQTTAVKTSGIGTCCGSANAGTGDQWFRVTSDFTVTSNNGDQFTQAQPTVSWTMNIEDPDQSGSGSGKFSQSISGSFVRNTGSFTSVQYPSGESQSNQITTATLP